MNTVSALQNQFQDYLLSDSVDFENNIVETKKVSKSTRLSIYKNGYALRFIEALSHTYPALKKYAGDVAFEKLCLDYIAIYPSMNWSMRHIGNQLSAFIKQHRDYQKMPYLAELAQLEWITDLLLDASDVAMITIEEMAFIPAEKWALLRFQFHPSLHRFNFKWNVVEMWEQLLDDKTASKPVKNNNFYYFLAWRQDFVCQYQLLSTEEMCALDAALQHHCFGDICETLCEVMAEEMVGQCAASFLKTWIVRGMVVSVSSEARVC